MSASASYHFDAQASLVKKNIAASGTTTATLDDTTGVSSVLWTVTAAYGSSTSDWSLSSTTGTSTVVTAPAGTAKSCILQCKVNGGVYVDPVTGRQSQGGQTIRTAKIYLSPETIVTGETTESDATNGWSPIVNAAIVGTSGTTALSGTALNLSEGGDSLSLTRPGSNLWVMTAGSGDSIKIDSAANITLDVGGASGTIDLTHADVSTCALVLDSDGPLTCTVGQAVTSVTFGQTQKTSGAGAAWTMRAQQGQAGNVGGALTIGGGLGGTPGTNKAGRTVIDLGAAVAGSSAELRINADSSQILTVEQLAAASHRISFGAGGGAAAAGVIDGTSINVESRAAHVALNANGGNAEIYLTCTFTECSGQLSSAPNAVAFSATPTLNANLSNHHEIAAMTADITTLDMSNARPGAIYTIEVLQDGTGGRTVGWAAKFVFGATYTNAPSATANHRTIWTFKAKSSTDIRCIGKETYTS